MWWFWNPWNPWWWVLGPREIELPVDRSRLEKFIGMLGSDHDGERANAARFISKMAQENRLTILELLKNAFGGSAHIYEKAQARDPWDDIRASRERDRKAREARDKEESDRAYWQKQKREREEANAYRQQQHERRERERQRRSAFFDDEPPWEDPVDKEEAARRWGGTKFDDVPPSESQWDAQQRARTAKRRSAKRNSGEPLI